MPRQLRKVSNTKVYHIIFKGNDQQDVFFDEYDYKKMLKEILKYKEKYNCDIYSYCLMTNHIHLIIYDKYNNISKMMQGILVSYSIYFGKKYNKIGHLFQERFYSKNVETKEYLLDLCRYIHQNPVKAGISRIEDYRWSSYLDYTELETNLKEDAKIINPKMILSLLGKTKQEAINNFINFHKLNEEKINDYVEFEMITKLTDEELVQRIKKILEIENIREIKKLNHLLRNEKIKKLKKIEGTTKIQISRVLGISRKIVERAMK